MGYARDLPGFVPLDVEYVLASTTVHLRMPSSTAADAYHGMVYVLPVVALEPAAFDRDLIFARLMVCFCVVVNLIRARGCRLASRRCVRECSLACAGDSMSVAVEMTKNMLAGNRC